MHNTHTALEQQTLDVIEQYFEHLESKESTTHFYEHMARLAYTQSYFFGPQVELAAYLESLGLFEERKSLIEATVARFKSVCMSKANFPFFINRNWDKKEITYIREIIYIARTYKRFSLQLLFLQTLLWCLWYLSSEFDGSTYANLTLQDVLSKRDLELIKQEVSLAEPYWTHNTTRQDALLIHQHTNAMLLRELENKGQDFIPVDGLHESCHSFLAPLFPETLRIVEDFARARGRGLGRVALVRLKPHASVYRHADLEPWLQGRHRYHVVIQSQKGSHMTSGKEDRVFYEGDVFFFDNKKMHTANNTSKNWRTHIIFDMQV